MDATFNVQTQQFEGPLDLLLTLIQDHKLYINEISLAQVTDAYISHLERYTEHPVAETAQFVYIASTLLLIKSRSLIPNMQITEEEAVDIADLENRLKMYRIIRTTARLIGKKWNTAPLLPSQYRPVIPIHFTPGGITLTQIHNAARHLISGFPAQTFRPEVQVATTLTIEEVVVKLHARIRKTTSLLFSEIKKGGSKPDIIVHFLALLELIKGGVVAAEQSNTFDDIVVATDSIETPRY